MPEYPALADGRLEKGCLYAMLDPMAGVRTAKPKVMTALRIPPDDLEEIRRRAEERGITVTQLLVDAALERLPEHTESFQQQLDQLTESVRRLEQIAFE